MRYDYIIAGAGLAGLSLAIRLADDQFSDKKILIVDRDKKNVNDRTWSFWQLDGKDRFKSIYHKTWHRLSFYAPGVSRTFTTAPYSYHTIKGIDFYQYALGIVEASEHIDIVYGEVGEILDEGEHAKVWIGEDCYRSSYVFDSIVRSFPVDDKLFVWQHFMGWEVEMKEDVFDEKEATFMDFRIEQEGDIRFVYVLPFSKQTALVEATLFSREICDASVYESILSQYMQVYYPDKEYTIKEKESGAIPMTTAAFARQSNRLIPIGTNNGTVKPSSGYAFVRIQEECDSLVANMAKGIYRSATRKARFAAYDKTFLNVLLSKKESGQRVFGDMFKYNNPKQILKFLDERTSLWEEVMFFKTLPILSFSRAFVEEQAKF